MMAAVMAGSVTVIVVLFVVIVVMMVVIVGMSAIMIVMMAPHRMKKKLHRWGRLVATSDGGRVAGIDEDLRARIRNRGYLHLTLVDSDVAELETV